MFLYGRFWTWDLHHLLTNSVMYNVCFWQYFLNPKIAVEPVPHKLELIVEEIVVPLLAVFHNIIDKVDIFKFLALTASYKVGSIF